MTSYPGLSEVRLAAQRGEVDGLCGLQVSAIKSILWDEFNNRASRVELYETSAEAVDSIEEVKAGRAKLLGVKDPMEERRERFWMVEGTTGGGWW